MTECLTNGYASDNGYSAGDGIAGRGPGYGIPSVRVDGGDVRAVYNATAAARDIALKHSCPVLIEVRPAMSGRVCIISAGHVVRNLCAPQRPLLTRHHTLRYRTANGIPASLIAVPHNPPMQVSWSAEGALHGRRRCRTAAATTRPATTRSCLVSDPAAERARCAAQAMSYRSGHHSTSDDSSRYRTAGEMAAWRARDPAARFRRLLDAAGWWDDAQEQALRQALRKEVWPFRIGS